MFCSNLSSKLRKAYIRKNTVNTFIDEAGNQVLTIQKRNDLYKVPAANVFFWAPKYYIKGQVKGSFQRFEQQNGKFFAIYKASSGETYFTVNNSLEVVEI